MLGGKAYLWACALIAFASSSSVINAQSAYDVIVVGSGPGGLVAAEFLSRDPSVSVLIIEAGPKSLAATGGTQIPDYARSRGLTVFDMPGEYENIGFTSNFDSYLVNWLAESNIKLGKLVGGCSSLNAALYFRPPNDYVTNSSWPFSVDSMVTKMDENERTQGFTDKPSADGIWYTQEGYNIVANAFRAQGYTEKTINSAEARNSRSKTFGHAPFAIKNGRRDSPANAFWSKMSTRTNVKLVTDTLVDYIFHSAGKATGVMYGGNRAQLSSRGAVIMAAGALSTPKVLIQSGIGPADRLNMLRGNSNFPGAQGESIVNPYVGRNVFDTSTIISPFSHPDMKSFRYRDYPSWAINQYINDNGSGPWSSTGPVLIGYENFEVQGRQYEFQATVLTHGFGEFEKRNDTLTIALSITNPDSRTASGFDSNGVWHAFMEGSPFFSTNRDLVAMQQYTLRVVSAMTAQGATFLSNGSDSESVARWVASSPKIPTSQFGGGCSTSSDSSAGSTRCADDKLRVVGTSNIFVADGSAMRDGTMNPYGFIMYIGREAAEQAASYISSGGNGGASTGQGQAQGTSCSAIEENVDYSGNDLGSAMSSTAENCCGICQSTTSCTAYTWTNFNGGTCWLKSAKGNATTNPGARSAQLN